MSDRDPHKFREFLAELSKLSSRHKIGIAGCGCCGSPWLYHDESIRGGKYEFDAHKPYQNIVFVSKKAVKK